jgi:hypothetical protein
VVTTSLPVDTGLNVPQAAAGEQLHFTPALSWETLALMLAVWLG